MADVPAGVLADGGAMIGTWGVADYFGSIDNTSKANATAPMCRCDLCPLDVVNDSDGRGVRTTRVHVGAVMVSVLDPSNRRSA